tara:strand:+ start:25 stop:384 length:360 start_codon:yes stop_codon:yes gene_type:complete
MNKMSNSTRILLYSLIAFIFSLIFPWWIISVTGTAIGFFAKTRYWAIVDSLALPISWFIMIINNFYIQESKFIIIDRMELFLGLNSIALIMITLIIPIVIGIVSSLFGYELRKVVSDDE